MPWTHAARCKVCTVDEWIGHGSRNLLLCSGCKLVTYCGPEHQKVDRAEHKDLCRAVKKLLAVNKIKHISELSVSEMPVMANARKMYISWTINLAAQVVQNILNRQLTIQELSLFGHPIMCKLCHSFVGARLLRCDRCHFVFYCSMQHLRQDKDAHRIWCNDYRVLYLMDESMPKYSKHNTVPILAKRYMKQFPKNLIQLVNITHRLHIKAASLDVGNAKMLSIYSCVGTILAALDALDIVNEVGEQLVLFVASFDVPLDDFDRDTCAVLFTFLRKLKRLIIHNISPLMPTEGKKSVDIRYEDDRMVQIYPHNSIAEALHTKTADIGTPDLIVCYNWSFPQYYKKYTDASHFDMAAIVAATSSVPFVITTYTRNDSNILWSTFSQLQRREDGFKRQLICYKRAEPNPFRAFVPMRNPHYEDGDDELFFANGYLTMLTSINS